MEKPLTGSDVVASQNRFAELVEARKKAIRADIKSQILAQSTADPDMTDLMAEIMAHFYCTIYENGIRNIAMYGQHFNGMPISTPDTAPV